MRGSESSPNLLTPVLPESPPANASSAINNALADLAHCHGLSSAFESASSLGSTLDDYEQVQLLSSHPAHTQESLLSDGKGTKSFKPVFVDGDSS